MKDVVPQTRGALYRSLKVRLNAAGLANPELDARLLLSAAASIDDIALIAAPDELVSGDALARLEGLVSRRLEGEPVSRILGRREFWGLRFLLNQATLDPRPDSETLVDLVLKTLPDRGAPLRVLDLGTGTGCLLLSILSEYRYASGVGVDQSEEAIAGALENARSLGLLDRVTLLTGDWARGLDERFDLIVSNPPYIPSGDIAMLAREVRVFDPLLALDGGLDGLDAYRQLAPEMTRLLRPGGLAVWEFGEGQARGVRQIAHGAGLEARGVFCDLSGLERAIMVSLPV